jgi:hypothetical protein
MTTSPAPLPPAALKPTFEKHLDATKWVIGLPVAILFGTTQFADKIDFAKHPYAGRLFLLIILVNAGAVVMGIIYYFAAISRADRNFRGKPDSPTLEVLDSFSFFGAFGLVAAGFLLTVVGLANYPAVQFERNPLPAVTVAHYAISISGPVRDRMGTHVHTFLVNENTGEVWRMECRTPSSVQFLRVPVQDLPAPKPKDPLK